MKYLIHIRSKFSRFSLPVTKEVFHVFLQRWLKLKYSVFESMGLYITWITLESIDNKTKAVHVHLKDEKNGKQLIKTWPMLLIYCETL